MFRAPTGPQTSTDFRVSTGTKTTQYLDATAAATTLATQGSLSGRSVSASPSNAGPQLQGNRRIELFTEPLERDAELESIQTTIYQNFVRLSKVIKLDHLGVKFRELQQARTAYTDATRAVARARVKPELSLLNNALSAVHSTSQASSAVLSDARSCIPSDLIAELMTELKLAATEDFPESISALKAAGMRLIDEQNAVLMAKNLPLTRANLQAG